MKWPLDALRTSLLTGLLAALPAVSQAAQALPCPQGTATVAGASHQDFADVCAGASGAVAFLAGHGVTPSQPIAIEVTERLPAEAGPSAVGCYIETKRTAYLLSFDKFKAQKTWFGVRIDRAMYRAVASHEAAHALAACHFRIPNPSIRAKEYVAYVVMWSGMPPEMRKTALRHMKPEGFSHLDRFTPMLYLFDPMRFGAEAYLRFSASPDQTALIQDILSGRALTD